MITFYHDIEQDYDSQASALECRKIVYEFLKLEKKYNISSTYNIVGKLFVEQPDLIELIIREGQEVAFHSYNHFRNWKPEYFSNEISLCRKVSLIPKGYRSPRSQINQSAVQTLWDEGFYWTAERDQHSEPYYIYKGLIRLPITADDWPLYEGKITSGEWVQNFKKLIRDRSYVALGLHDFVAAQNPVEILHAWEEILQYAVINKAFSLNFSEAADLFRRANNSKNFLVNSNLNNKNNKIFPIEFDELIRIEIAKLKNPKVAFLCNHNEELPAKYKAIIDNENYLVIKSGNFYNNNDDVLDNYNSIINSIDLLIGIDSIEYVFMPECLAEEIKKLCKIGATFILNFSNSNGNSLTNEFKQNKMNYQSSPTQILKWLHQIGAGQLIRLNDKIPEQNNNTPVGDKNRSCDEKTKHYIYFGKVQNNNRTNQIIRIIPVAKASFRFPNPIIERYKINFENTGVKLIKPIKDIVKKVLSIH